MARACFTRNEIIPPLAEDAYIAHLLCDPWANPHINGPMFLYILTQRWPLVLLITGLNEVFEILLKLIFGDFAIFPEVDATNDFESITQALIDDWLTQGSIGLILGGLFVYAIRSPVVWTGWRTNRRQWWFYFFTAVVYFVITILFSMTIEKPPGLMGVSSTKPDKTDLWVGPYITTALIGGLILLAQYGENFYSVAWAKQPESKRRHFWNGYWAINVCFSIQATWDWFYSGAAQSWLLAGLFAIGLMGIIVVKGDWMYAIERFDSWADLWVWQPPPPPPVVDE